MWRHRRRSTTTFVAALVALVGACGDGSVEGTWRLASFEVAGEPVAFDGPLFLDVNGDGFRAETTCNRLEGEFGGEIASTAMGCSEPAHEGERRMTEALADGPVEVDGRLVFVGGDVTLIYEPFTDPDPEQLVSVLADERRDVDESALPPASVTGSVPPDYAALVPMRSPSPDIDLFVGSLDDGICVVVAAESRVGTSCSSTRDLAFETEAVRLPAGDAAGVRVALVPDRFAQPAARSELGTFDGNLLVIAEDVPAGSHVLTNTAEETLRLEIVDPPIDPPPTTVAETDG